MTISITENRKQYSGNGATTSFSFPYYFFEDTDLNIVLTDSNGTDITQVLNTDYTVTGAGNPSGGSITMTTAPDSGETLTILRNVPATQEIDYISGDSFPAETHERGLDRLTILVQQINDRLSRTLGLPDSYTGLLNLILPKPEQGDFMRWKTDLSGLENVPGSAIAEGVIVETDYVKVLDTVAS